MCFDQFEKDFFINKVVGEFEIKKKNFKEFFNSRTMFLKKLNPVSFYSSTKIKTNSERLP